MSTSAVRSSLRDFEIITQLGSGSFGKVFRVLRHRDGLEYVLKTIPLSSMNTASTQAAVNECQMLAQVRSPYIVRYYDSFIVQSPQEPTLHLVMEYCPNGDLSRYLEAQTAPLSPETIWRLFLQITIGIAELHRKRILHRDIKTLNIFMDANDNVKIGDLGVSRLLETESFAQTLVGTPYYISPELVNDQPYGRPSDIWALGVILYELCARRRPFTGQSTAALFRKIHKARYDPLPDDTPANLAQLVAALLARDPRVRPTASQLLLAARPVAAGLGVEMPNWIEDEAGSAYGGVIGPLPPAPAAPTAPAPAPAPAAASAASSEKRRHRREPPAERAAELRSLMARMQEVKMQRRVLLETILRIVQPNIYQEIRTFMENNNNSEEFVTTFVLSRISYSQLEVIGHIHDLISLDGEAIKLTEKARLMSQ